MKISKLSSLAALAIALAVYSVNSAQAQVILAVNMNSSSTAGFTGTFTDPVDSSTLAFNQWNGTSGTDLTRTFGGIGVTFADTGATWVTRTTLTTGAYATLYNDFVILGSIKHFTISGLTAGDQYRLYIQSYEPAALRAGSFTPATANLAGPVTLTSPGTIDANTGTSLFYPTASVTFGYNNGGSGTWTLSTLTADSSGDIVINYTGTSGNTRLNGLELSLVADPASAFWAGSTDNKWDTLGNWKTDATSNTTVAQLPGAQTNVSFDTTTPGATHLSTTLDRNFDINSLTFSAAATASVTIAGPGTLTIEATNANGNTSGNGITVNTPSSGTPVVTISANVALAQSQTWTVNTGGALAVSGTISGTGMALTKAGAGALTLTNTNTYTGGTTVSQGILSFANGSLGSSGNITVNGGTLQWNGSNTQDISSRLTLQSGGAATLDTNGNDVTLANGFGGNTNSSLTKAGAGTLTLSHANTYSGATTVNGGTLKADAAGALGTSSSLAVNTGGTLLLNASGASGSPTPSLTLNGGKLLLNAASTTTNTLGAITLSSSSTIDFGAGNHGGVLNLGSVTSWSGRLSIWDWSGTPWWGGSGDVDRLLVSEAAAGSWTSSDLASIDFYSDAGTTKLGGGGARLVSLGGGGYDLEIVAVPEPSTVVAGLLLAGIVGWRERRRISSLLAALATLRGLEG